MRKAGLLICSFFMLWVNSFAQQKYGHINSQEIQESMPEYKQLLATLDRKRAEQEKSLKNMYAQYQKGMEELQQFGPDLMVAVREEKMLELQKLQQDIETLQQTADAQLDQLHIKLLKPLNDKYLKIVNAVAKENGYTYIFDIATGSVVYYPESSGDITDLVKKKMGIN